MENHGSPTACNAAFFDWTVDLMRDRTTPLEVLDVGGGRGMLGNQTKRHLPKHGLLEWECIDIVGSTECAEFDGAVLPHANDSKDVVVFNYMLHRAADMTLSLLAHARRVACHHVVVEDLKGESPNEYQRDDAPVGA